MRVAIIEDEYLAREELISLLKSLRKDIEIVATAATVAESLRILPQVEADVLFMDIQLTDGLSFEIFEHLPIRTPVIFTTAFDQYAIRAFKVRAIDYLLKPVDEDELERALAQAGNRTTPPELLQTLMQELRQSFGGRTTAFRERFRVQRGNTLYSVAVQDTAYIFAEDKVTVLVSFDGRRHLIDQPIISIIGELDPVHFFQVSRKLIVNARAVRKPDKYFNHRLKLDLEPKPADPVVVPRDSVKEFVAWLGR